MKTKTTSTSRYLFGTLLVIFAICSTGLAITLFDTGPSTLVNSDPKQMLRLSRNDVPSDWSQLKAFPGTAGTGKYHYHTYTIPASAFANTPFVQITNDDPTASLFVSTYLNSYNPNNFSTNYFADAGFSGGFAVLAETGFFQLHIPPGNDLVIVVNDTITSNGGLNQPYRVLVEGFTDTEYSNRFNPQPRLRPRSLRLRRFQSLSRRRASRKVTKPPLLLRLRPPLMGPSRLTTR